MSKEIDERIVSMQFDNRQFERNVSNTMSTLDKLKQKLNLSGASKGLEDVNAAARKTDFSPMARGIEAVQAKFSALEVMGVTALANLTNSAVNYGKRMVSALTIDPVKTGFQEYETQINSVQTILANTESKGTTLKQVNAALDELNTYADKTIYNFTEMTRNIGTFTAAGVELDTSVAAIKGIANLAAVSGSTSQQASTAMYQLSQALASGTVKLMDWNSVVNAGMGGQVFQDSLKETAKIHGVNIDAMIKKEGSFRETLKNGWLTSEILLETLSKFTGDLNEEQLKSMGYTEAQIKDIIKLGQTANDAATKVKTYTQLVDTLKESAQSGWSQTWKLLVGDFGEAKELWTGVSNVLGGMIEESSKARNNLLSGALLSGWDQLLGKGIADEEGYKETIQSVAKSHGVAIDEMIKKEGSFDKALVSGLKDGTITSDMLTESVNKLAEKMGKMSDAELKAAGYTKDHVSQIQTLTKCIQNGSVNMDEFAEKMTKMSGRELIIQSIKNAFEGIVSVIKPIKEAFRDIFPRTTSEQLYSVLESIHELTSKFKLSDEHAEQLRTTFKGLFSVIAIGVDIIKSVLGGAVKIFGSLLGFGSNILDITSSIGEWLINLRTAVIGTNTFGEAVDKVVGVMTSFIDRVREALSSDGVAGFASLLERAGSKLLDIGRGIMDILATIGSGIMDVISNIIGGMGVDGLMNAIKNGALVGLILYAKKFITSLFDNFNTTKESVFGKLHDVLDNLSEVFDKLAGCLKDFQTKIKADALRSIAISIGILAAAILVLSSIDQDKMYSALGAITMLFADLIASMKLIGKFNIGGVMSAGFVMIEMSVAVLILASALKKLASLEMDEIKRGLAGVLGLTAMVVVAAKLLATNGKKTAKGAFQLILFAEAINILAGVCRKIAQLSWDEIEKGLTGVGILLAEVAAFMIAAKYGKMTIRNAVGIVILSSALAILASVCGTFASMSWDDIAKGLSSVGILLVELAAAVKVMGRADKLISAAVTMTIIGGALKFITSSVEDLATLSWNDLMKGLVGVAAMLFSVSFAARSMPKSELVDISIALASAAFAITELTDAILLMSGVTWSALAKGLITMAVGLKLMTTTLNGIERTGVMKTGGAMFVMATSILILATSLKLLGSIGIAGTVLGLVALAATFGIIALAVKMLRPIVPTMLSFSASIAILSGSLLLLAAGMTLVGASLIPIVAALVSVILTLQFVSWGNIAKGFVVIAGAFALMGLSAKLLRPLIPTLIKLSGSIALMGLSCLSVALAVALVVTSLSSLSALGPEAAKNIVSSLMIIVVGILSVIPPIIASLGETIKTFIFTIVDVIAECAPKITEGLLKTILGILSSLAKYTPQIVAALAEFIIGTLDQLTIYIPQIIDSLVSMFIAVIAGIAKRLPDILSAVFDFLGKFFDGVAEGLKKVDTDSLLKGIAGVGLLAVLMKALAAAAPLIPQAAVGVAGIMAIIGEIAILLAAIGALAQIPGLSWLVSEGGNLLEGVGIALGKFVGGFVGGVFAGIATTLPSTATCLSEFMTNLAPFIEGAKHIDGAALAGVTSLTLMMLELTAASVLEALLSIVTLGTFSLSGFASQLVPFGEAMAKFSESISGKIDSEAVNAAANAGKTLVELTNSLPYTGGLFSMITGTKDLVGFGEAIKIFGEAMVDFSDIVAGNIDSDAVTAAATAGETMVKLADTIPNTGGAVAFFAGDNDLTSFAKGLIPFAKAMVEFSDIVAGGISTEAIEAAANAGETMAKMAKTIPNTGGAVAFFTGDNDMETFGEQLIPFGKAIAEFSKEVSGKIDSKAVAAAANAGETMAKMADTLPNTGGLVSFFAGDNDMETFGKQLVPFGKAIAEFSKEVSGKIDEAAVVSAANAGKTMAEMAKTLPNTGGVFSFFTGATMSMEEFGNQLKPFGEAMASFSSTVSGKIDSKAVESAANAGKTMAGMADALPKKDGLFDIFTGSKTSIEEFGNQLKPFGEAMVGFSLVVAGQIDGEAVVAASNAGKAMAEMCDALPKEGGIFDVFTGSKTSIEEFSNQLVPFGKAMVEFSKEVSGKINSESVTAASTAGKALAEMCDALPDDGGWLDIFTGSKTSIEEFGAQLGPFGEAIAGFATEVKDIKVDNVETAVKAVESIVKMADENISRDLTLFFNNDFSRFPNAMKDFGKAIKSFSDEVKGVGDASEIDNAISAGNKVADMLKELPDNGNWLNALTGTTNLGSLAGDLEDFGEAIVAFSEGVKGVESEELSKAKEAIAAISGMSGGIVTALDVVGKITGWTGNKDIVAENFEALGKGVVAFSNSLSTDGGKVKINGDAIASSKTAVQAIGGMGDDLVTALTTIGKLTSWTGSKSTVVDNFETLGESIMAFYNSITVDGVSSIDAEAIKNASTACSAIGAIDTEKLKPVLEAMSGDTTATGGNVSSNLANLGQAIVGFSNAVTSSDGSAINTSSIESAVGALNKIGELDEGLIATVSILNNLSSIKSENGVSALTKMGSLLYDLGRAVVGFSQSLVGMDGTKLIDEAAMTSVGTALEAIGGLKDSLPGAYSTMDELTKVTGGDFSKFKELLIGLGGAVLEFSKSVAGEGGSSAVDLDAIDDVKTAVGKISEMNNDIPETLKLSSFGDVMNTFIAKLKSFDETLSTMDLDTLSSKIESVKNISSNMTDIGEEGVQGFIGAFTNASSAMEIAIDNLMNTATTTISESNPEFGTAGKGAMDQFVIGMKSKDTDIETASNSLVSTAASEIKLLSNFLKFASAGQYMVDGFIAGINSKITSAATAAANMASAAETAAREELDINSPSKVFEEVGEGVPEGFINGIGSLGTGIKNAVSGMANVAVNTATSSMSRVASAFNGGFDLEPTIRPVMDMSSASFNNVKLEADISTTLSRPVDSMAKIMADAQSEINTSNQAVISSINGLREDLNAFCASTEKEVSLYVDSKRLASSIAKPMNQQLNILSRRGAY